MSRKPTKGPEGASATADDGDIQLQSAIIVDEKGAQLRPATTTKKGSLDAFKGQYGEWLQSYGIDEPHEAVIRIASILVSTAPAFRDNGVDDSGKQKGFSAREHATSTVKGLIAKHPKLKLAPKEGEMIRGLEMILLAYQRVLSGNTVFRQSATDPVNVDRLSKLNLGSP
jgi:hypothetical protein